MNLKQHSPYLYRLIHYGLINCYLIVEEDGLTIIDTGLGGTAKLLEQTVTRLESPVRRIVLTHADSDHIGGLDVLHRRYPEAEVLVSRREARLLSGDTTLDSGEAKVALRKKDPGVETRPSRLFGDGERIMSLRAVASPGHTPGHMAFLDTRDNSLIAGDAFVTHGGFAVAGQMRWLFPLPHLATWHAPTALKSAQKLTAMEPTRLAVGHGPVLENPTEAMRRVTEQFSRRLARAG